MLLVVRLQIAFAHKIHAAAVQSILVLIRDDTEELLSLLALAVLVDIDFINSEDGLTSGNQFWCLFLLVPEVPQPNDFITGAQQLIIFIVQNHGLTGDRLELEKQILGDQVVLVHDGVHGN